LIYILSLIDVRFATDGIKKYRQKGPIDRTQFTELYKLRFMS